MPVFSRVTSRNPWAIEVQGVKELNALLAQLPARTAHEVGKQLYQLANEIMTASKDVVPVDTGALRASGQVGLPEVTGDQVSVTLGYGDTAATYAIPVHERADLYHKPPTGWKFLERPTIEAAERVGKAVAQGVTDAVAGDTA